MNSWLAIQPKSSSFPCFEHQMKMVSHQAEGVDLPAGLHAGLAQRFQNNAPPRVILKNRLPAVAAIHPMIDRSGKFNS
jgi:hypothetical protein